MGKVKDLTGQKFGRLLVLRKDESRLGKNSYWICQCDCGVEKSICATALRHGQKSCGCTAFDFAKDKVIGNEYSVDECGVVHVILRSREEMLCDIDDWERLKDYTWTKDAHGYAVTHINRKIRKFHIEVKGKKTGYVVDHIDKNKLNNQQDNLRFLTKSGNAINSKLSQNSSSGIKGVSQVKSGKWVAQLMIDGKHIHLGTYDTKEEAEIARKAGEEKYHIPVLKDQGD